MFRGACEKHVLDESPRTTLTSGLVRDSRWWIAYPPRDSRHYFICALTVADVEECA